MNDIMEKIRNKNGEIKIQEITENDIQNFADYYNSILILKNVYDNSIWNRKQIAQEIRNRLMVVKTFLHCLDEYDNNFDNEFSHLDNVVNDPKLALRLIIRLASIKNNMLVMRHFVTSDLLSFEEEGMISNYDYIGGNIYIIGNKEVLNANFNKEYYYTDDMSDITTNILNNNKDLIIYADRYFNDNIKPNNRNVEEININTGMISQGISCYVFNDDLKDVINKFEQFIEENGADIKEIDEDKLFEYLKNYEFHSNKNLKREIV